VINVVLANCKSFRLLTVDTISPNLSGKGCHYDEWDKSWVFQFMNILIKISNHLALILPGMLTLIYLYFTGYFTSFQLQLILQNKPRGIENWLTSLGLPSMGYLKLLSMEKLFLIHNCVGNGGWGAIECPCRDFADCGIRSWKTF